MLHYSSREIRAQRHYMFAIVTQEIILKLMKLFMISTRMQQSPVYLAYWICQEATSKGL